jgi:hypothetical protein
MNIDPVDGTDVHKVAQPVQCWANEGGATVAIIDKLSLGWHWHAITASALTERSNLTFDGVRSRLLFPGDTRIKRSSNRSHRSLRREAEKTRGCDQVQESFGGSELNLEKENQMSETSTLISCAGKITRAELAKLPTPYATETHIPISANFNRIFRLHFLSSWNCLLTLYPMGHVIHTCLTLFVIKGVSPESQMPENEDYIVLTKLNDGNWTTTPLGLKGIFAVRWFVNDNLVERKQIAIAVEELSSNRQTTVSSLTEMIQRTEKSNHALGGTIAELLSSASDPVNARKAVDRRS